MLLVACVFVSSAVPAAAWEIDVHYILTFWLAQQAGFSREDAFAIAQADQEVDDSDYTSAIGSMIWILLWNDKGAAENVKRLHFPSDAPFPSPPTARVVKPNSPDARREAENCIKLDTAGDALKRFGTALHPLQDSWSHQGVPDVPLRPVYELRPELSSSHPEARGGWNSHDADLTYLHIQEAREMARVTYDFLVRYLKANPKRQRTPTKAWTTLTTSVDEFAAAATREAKNDWAVKHVPQETQASGAVAVLTLPGPPSASGRVRYLKPQDPGASDAPPELEARARNFVKTWISVGSPAGASEFVDAGSIGETFGAMPGFAGPNRPAAARTWVRKTLAIYLAGNHAAINADGHGLPSAPGYQQIPEGLVPGGGPLQMRAVPDVALPARTDFIRAPGNAAPSWILAIRKSDLPHDALAVTWQQRGSTWMIVQIIPIVN